MPFIIGSPVLLSSFASHLIAIFNRRNTSIEFRQRKLQSHKQISTYYFGCRITLFTCLELLLLILYTNTVCGNHLLLKPNTPVNENPNHTE